MKKLIYPVLAFILLTSTHTLAGPSESSFDIKLGVGYPNAGDFSPGQAELDSSFSFNLGLDKFFALGFEAGLHWTSWETYTPGAEAEGIGAGDRKAVAHALGMPFMLNARVRYDLRKKYYIMPYLVAGAGYTWSFFLHPDQEVNFGGFTWQALLGTSIQPVKDYFVEIIIEAGYRNTIMSSTQDYRLDNSGFIGRVGVRFNLGILDDVREPEEKVTSQH